jgi:pSer/pThr/pTyr-binding forkhead associated (FHA) protein
MKRPPVIAVQLIHIFGPMKGQIQEFAGGKISIGRHSSCHLRFPADLTIVSRQHAEIVREGNQFKLVDHSANGTFVNGKKVKETFLKNGDVLAFAEGGPKVSFLTQIKDSPPEAEVAPEPLQQEEPEKKLIRPAVEKPVKPQPVMEEAPKISVQTVQIPLVIQYGPTIRSFKELPVTIGKSSKCGFVLMHPAILDQHAQIFFSENQYRIKDLTGQNMVRLNQRPVSFQAPLNPDDEISLSPQGPVFRFLGEGRLAEVETQSGKVSSSKKTEAIPERDIHEEKVSKGILSRFKGFWNSE